MTDLIIYTPVCANCKYRKEINALRSFATEQQLTLVTRRTDYVREYRELAGQISSLALPFVYNTKTAKSVPLAGLTSGSFSALL